MKKLRIFLPHLIIVSILTDNSTNVIASHFREMACDVLFLGILNEPKSEFDSRRR